MGSCDVILVGVSRSSPASRVSSWPIILIFIYIPKGFPWCDPPGWKTDGFIPLGGTSKFLLVPDTPFKPLLFMWKAM